MYYLRYLSSNWFYVLWSFVPWLLTHGPSPHWSTSTSRLPCFLSGHYQRWRNIQERTLAQRVLHLHTLPEEFSGRAFHQPRREALLRRMLRWTIRQALHGLQQAHHRHRRHQVHLLRRPPLAQRLLLLRLLPHQPGGPWLHHRQRGHHLSRVRQAEVNVN